MDYGMIGKIEKAKRYAQERDRIRVRSMEIIFSGENNSHTMTLQDGHWNCTCDFFHSRGRCSHTMAMEEILAGMKGLESEEETVKA